MQDLTAVQAKMRASLQDLESKGYSTELSFQESYDCIVNAPYGLNRVLSACEALGVQAKQDIPPFSFVEDFCYYLQHCPGAFYFLGAGDADKAHPLHSPYYDIDEEALVVGASIMSLLALKIAIM